MIKKKLLIVGAFPKKKFKIYGGIAKSSDILIDSKSFSKFDIIKLDSSQISNPPPGFFVRLILAINRYFKLLLILLKKPHGALIFCSDGASALEKGFMILTLRIFNVKSFIFPRAGNLITQVKNFNFFRLLIKFLFNKADVFLCQGKTWKKFALNSLNLKSKKIKLISNWSASEELFKIGTNRSYKTDRINILYVGWLEKEKGIKELLDGFYKCLIKNKNISLTLIGDGNMRSYTENFIEKNKINNHIHLTGWLPSKKVNSYLKDSNIFILPSWNEGMPNALIEALASGVPSIVTRVGVIPDYLKNNFSAILINTKSSLDIEESLNKLINNNDLQEKISINGKEVARKFFSSKRTLDKFSKIIEETLN
tara:strand:- start:15570 stop:16673 length:1104 start_codon:yes stop_codon:yes gene_type:complete